ncbi:A disintegrin and metalloproteinase with thrombospondin motifs 12 [Diachasma alloeum]|uniref:A disintegrin and metalloproteinase with thrombospondin motifs 12 n=1 Tax=Diachasma alloeum TaxID=454923 RepID=UPI0007383B1A|nr:A disintegrin and metalloproteinase with thrombospondin motifs 12 [Diachasma alloeum]
MDYSLYITQPDFKTAVTYLMAFWNAVDLRFKLLTQPRIELNIAAFIISIQNGGTPFIMGTGNESRLVNTSDALGAMRKFFYPDGKIPVNYDIAIAMTQLDLYFGAFVRVITGMAYVAAPCNLSPSENEIFSLAIVEDNGAFRNVLMAAHELGHLLGADHDGEKENKNCTGNQGLLMSPAIGFLEEYYYWSDCSIQQIRKLMNSKLAACLFNVPQPGRPPQALLPGEVKSLDEQCQIAVGTNVCRHKMENICETLWCLDPEKEGSCVNPSAAAEGSICGDYKHCMSGMCVGTLGMSILVHKHSSR